MVQKTVLVGQNAVVDTLVLQWADEMHRKKQLARPILDLGKMVE